MYLSRLFLVHIQICIYTHRNACARMYTHTHTNTHTHTHTHTHTRLCFSFCFYQWDILHLCKMFLHLISLRGFFLYQCVCIHFLILNSAISLLMAIYAVSNFLLSPKVLLLQEGGPPPGLKSGLLSNTRKWIVRGDARADKARDFIGKGCPGGEQEGKRTQDNCCATWVAVSGFVVMGLVSRLSLANQGPSRWRRHCSAKMNASKEGRVPYWDLLLWNNSCSGCVCCLARVGGFSQCISPNSSVRILLHLCAAAPSFSFGVPCLIPDACHKLKCSLVNRHNRGYHLHPKNKVSWVYEKESYDYRI